MEVDITKTPTSRTNTPIPASWFEFLLDSSYLEKHLSKENPDPPPCELIIQFLTNAVPPLRDVNSVPPMIGGLGENKVELVDPTLEMKPNVVETKKMQALKLLAISVAAFLHWELDILEKQLPLPMQNTLLLDFLILAFGEDSITDMQKQISLDFASLSDQALFALHLYHRWIIRALMLDSIPAKIPRTVNVPLPGQQIPSFVPPASIEVIVKMLHDSWLDSKFILEKLNGLNRNVMIPTLKTFEIPSETKLDVQHNWESGILISSEELQCQVCYDLGCLYFFNEDYPKAGEMFYRVRDLLTKMSSSNYCYINPAQFQGYLKACNVVLRKNTKANNYSLTFEEKLLYSVDNNYEHLIDLLLEDNLKQKTSIAYRDYLEQSIQSKSFSNSEQKRLHTQVCACNVIREVLNGNAVASKYLQNLSQNLNDEVETLFDIIHSTVEKANVQQKLSLKNFLKFLIGYEKTKVLPLVVETKNLAALFTKEEKAEWMADESTIEKSQFEIKPRDYSGNVVLQTGELERDLLKSYNPGEIKLIIKKLSNMNTRKPLWKINTVWELPNPVANFVLNLAPGVVQDYVYIMIAKARELAKLKSFDEARQLLDIVEHEVADLSPKLNRAIRWEILLIDMNQIHANSTVLDMPSADLIRRCKTCITALHQDKEFLPRPEIIEFCAAYLLSVEQWDYLSTNDYSCSSRLEFAAVLAKACLEIRSSNGGRKAVKEFWELVLPIFSSNSSQQKRMASGLSVIQREAPHAIFSRQSLNQFLQKIQNATVLSVMISCLAKLHNILKDDNNNNIYMEYPSPWPVVVSNSSAFHIKAVYESLSSVLNHSLKLFPHHVPCLKSMADLNYVLGYHTKCLKYYLEAAIVSSDFFGQPIPKSTFDDQVYKRMIRCCSQLSCHTQAAVLCQFLEDVDYLTAFKSLQEKNCSDAMDAYYDCFWDVTVLEFLVYLHSKRGEMDKKQLVLKIMGQLELNPNNNDEIKREAANLRKSNFMRALVEQFL